MEPMFESELVKGTENEAAAIDQEATEMEQKLVGTSGRHCSANPY